MFRPLLFLFSLPLPSDTAPAVRKSLIKPPAASSTSPDDKCRTDVGATDPSCAAAGPQQSFGAPPKTPEKALPHFAPASAADEKQRGKLSRRPLDVMSGESTNPAVREWWEWHENTCRTAHGATDFSKIGFGEFWQQPLREVGELIGTRREQTSKRKVLAIDRQ